MVVFELQAVKVRNMIFRQLYFGEIVLHLVYFGNQMDVTEDALLDENVEN